jgi:hypothetical protein
LILYCNFEELAAVSAGGHRLVDAAGDGDHPVIAPPQAQADLEALLPRLVGDIEVATLSEQRSIERALAYLLADLAIRMDQAIVAQHAAAEDAVLAYFDYAHTRATLDRVQRMGAQMAAIIELATGAAPDDVAMRTFSFLD